MTYSDTGIGHILLYNLGNMWQIGYAIVDEIHLTIATHLEVYGLGYNLGREGMYLGLYRIAVGRRCLDDAQIACTNQREL